MDSAEKTKGKDALNIVESLGKDGDLKSALEKAKLWAVSNPVPTGKSCMTQQFGWSLKNRITQRHNKTTKDKHQFSPVLAQQSI